MTLAALACPAAMAAASDVETVIVSAERRPQALQDVAGQVAAFGADDIDRLGARTIADLAGFVPGMTYLKETGGSNLLVLRGVTTGSTQLNGAAALYLDDVPIGTATPFGLGASAFSLNSFDLQRVEILSGPQGTLYGANALGGALRYVMTAPDVDTLSLKGEAQGSSSGHGGINDGLYAAANLPFDGGALRLSGVSQFESGIITDPAHNRSGLGDARTLGGRGAVLLQPASNIRIQLGIFTQSIVSNGIAASFRDPVTHRAVQGPYDQSFALAQPTRDGLQLYSGTVNWDLQWASLTSVSGYQIDKGFKLLDESTAYDALLSPVLGAGVANLPFGVTFDVKTKKFTQELRLASPDNQSFEWLAGFFYDNEQTVQAIHFFNAANPAGLLNGVPMLNSRVPASYREIAVFGDATIFLTDRLDLTLGLRYSQNHQLHRQVSSGLLNNFAAPAAVTDRTAVSGGNVATFLVNPRYRVSDGLMLYARAANGYRPGGPNFVTAASLNLPSFMPDHLWNTEAGFKSTPFDHVFFDADVYDIEWTAIQLNENHGGINQIANEGNARIQGLESSLRYRRDGDSIAASAAFTDARLTTPAPGLAIAATGTRLPLSPHFSFSLSASHDVMLDDLPVQLRLSDRYAGSRNDGYAGSTVDPLYRLAAYNSVDAGLALALPQGVALEFSIRNLFDVRGEVSATTFANHYVPSAPVPVELSQPRTIGVTLRGGL